MSASDEDPIKLRIQLEVLKERIKHLEAKKSQQEQELTHLSDVVRQKDAEIGKIRDERDDLRIKWEGMGIEIKHLQDSLTQDGQSKVKKKRFIKHQGILAALIFFASAGLSSYGINLLTQKPPELAAGIIMMGFAFVVYVVATLMTRLAAEGGI